MMTEGAAAAIAVIAVARSLLFARRRDEISDMDGCCSSRRNYVRVAI